MCGYDDPEVEAKWFSERRIEVAEYLQPGGVIHGMIADEPAWHAAPYVSLWAIESFEGPGALGWWAISGDLPNDHVSASKAGNPRDTIQAMASLWRETAGYMERGDVLWNMHSDGDNLATPREVLPWQVQLHPVMEPKHENISGYEAQLAEGCREVWRAQRWLGCDAARPRLLTGCSSQTRSIRLPLRGLCCVQQTARQYPQRS